MSPFQSLADYERFVYTLQVAFSSILRSTLTISTRGRTIAVLEGEIDFAQGYRLSVLERLTFNSTEVKIESYGYEGWHNSEKIYWYDSQPHPKDLTLASTHPHHKHIPPDIKHHRIPAQGLSFEQPNLPLLITEIEALAAKEVKPEES